MNIKIPVSLLLALVTTVTAAAQSREYTLDINVSNTAGISMSGVAYTLHNNLYDVDYSSTETLLDENGHSSIRTYGGSHTLRIAVAGLRTYTSTFDISADKTLDIVMEEDIRTPYSLHANLRHNAYTGQNDIVMDWNSEEAVFFDDFESYSPFTTTPSPWTGIDLDGVPAAGIDGSYPNRETTQYITIANPSAVNPAWDTQYYYTLAPQNGKQYAAFVQPSSGNNNDWFISPQIEVGEDNVLRFYMRKADDADARIRVAVSTAENPTQSDFVTISEGNYLAPGFEEWQQVIIPLTEYAGQTVRIGFNCTSRAGVLMTMLDDVFVGRINAAAQAQRVVARSAENPNEKFEISLDGTKIAETDDYNYTIENVAAGNHTVAVKAIYLTGQSDSATADVVIDNSNYVKATFNLSTNNGRTTDGITLAIDGEQTYSLDMSGGTATMAAIPKGNYTARIESEGYEKLEKEFTADTDNVIALTLVESIVTPFNITADVAEVDGKFDVTLNWNRDLGFTDSFEEYRDFATGTFGGWTTLNFNGEHQVSYPISIGGQEVQYPGCSLSSAPKSVPPMVFNPNSTRPSLADDAAFAAPYGEKILTFMGPQQNVADKWAISPEMKIYDNYRLSLVAKAYPVYPETLQLLISTTGSEPEDFQLLDEVTLSYEEWTQFTIDLKEYAGKSARIAIRCVTYDGFVALVDDVRIEPADDTVAQSAGFVNDYEVRLDDGTPKVTTVARQVFRSVDEGSHTAYVKANYATGSSPEAQYQFNVSSSIEGVTASVNTVIGGNGVITVIAEEMTDVAVYSLTGMNIASFRAEGTSQVAVRPGIYLVTLNGETFKVSVR